MEGTHLLRDLLQPNDWMGKIVLKDAYFVIPIWENHQKFLRFLWKDSVMEFACLPFGLASAPRIFTKLMKPVVALLSQIWHTPNNLLGRHFVHEPNSYRASAGNVNSNSFIRKPRFFVINLTKSQLKPTQTLEFLGFIVDTKNMTLVLPQGKVTAIKDLCSQMLSQTELTVRDIARLIGKLTASIQAIFPAPLHYRQLQSLKNIALQSGSIEVNKLNSLPVPSTVKSNMAEKLTSVVRRTEYFWNIYF